MGGLGGLGEAQLSGGKSLQLAKAMVPSASDPLLQVAASHTLLLLY